MLNKKGQSLVLFIIIMPVILIMLAMGIEFSLLAYKKHSLTSITKSIIANCIDTCKKNDIIELYNKNDIDVDALDVIVGDKLEIRIQTSVKIFMGKIIGKDKYILSVNIVGYKENNKIYYEKG